MSELDTHPPCLEQHFTIRQVAKAWGLGYGTVRRLFEFEPGVLRIEHRLRAKKRGYVSYRIPEHIAARVHARLTANSRGVGATERRADLLQIGNRKGVG